MKITINQWQEFRHQAKHVEALVKALEACVARLEASQPPLGGITAQTVQQARAALDAAKEATWIS